MAVLVNMAVPSNIAVSSSMAVSSNMTGALNSARLLDGVDINRSSAAKVPSGLLPSIATQAIHDLKAQWVWL